MASTSDLEETLPLTAPEPAFPLIGPTREIKYSVYATTSLDHDQRQQLLADLHSDYQSIQSCRIAPGQFQHNSLREVYDYHIHARDENATTGIHPDYFIVIDQPDWDTAGVLIVHLRVGTEQKDPSIVIGVSRVDVRGPLGAESTGMNLDIANIDWMDVKNSECIDWGGDDPFANQRYYPTDPRTALVPTYSSTIYVWYSLIRRVLPIESMLEPDSFYYNPGQSRFAFRGSFARESEPWIMIRRRHPWACLTSDRICRKLFLVAEKEDADSENGMAVYKVNWDGDLSGFSDDDDLGKEDHDRLLAIEPEIECVKYIRASRAIQELDTLADAHG